MCCKTNLGQNFPLHHKLGRKPLPLEKNDTSSPEQPPWHNAQAVIFPAIFGVPWFALIGSKQMLILVNTPEVSLMNDTAAWLVIQAANMAEGGKRQPSSLCFCSAKKTVHVHCCCSSCNGKPVNYRTQISHLEFERNLEASNAVSVAGNLLKLWTSFSYSLLSNCGHFARNRFAPKRWFARNKGRFQAHQTYNLPRLNFQRCICCSSHPLPIQCKAS